MEDSNKFYINHVDFPVTEALTKSTEHSINSNANCITNTEHTIYTILFVDPKKPTFIYTQKFPILPHNHHKQDAFK